ncbi:FixH family protein [Maribacter sp. 4G9]|uniref:FixH family protein n=1 Tax=Maribacter sp. 4G9 TaxID=1889777 RepID=UPI000C15D855|nr:FixH family protein [Maribacter sp. 4G9]PIB38743.1 cytochrome C oxidase Cbb3 [Maribacter sp. 4G9]
MKINWGTGIVLAFIGFIGFIMFFVVRMSTDTRANHDLVTEDYYRQELAYQKEIDAQNNANKDINQVEVNKSANGLEIVFPIKLNPKEIEGTVSLYRPSNKQLDFDLPISLSNNHLLIPDNRLLDGRWDIKIRWNYNGTEYLHKEKITY